MRNSKCCAWPIGLAFEDVWLLESRGGFAFTYIYIFFIMSRLQVQLLQDLCRAVRVPKT